MSNGRITLLAIVSLLVLACRDDSTPVAPHLSDDSQLPAFSVSGPAGVEGFHFLAPIGGGMPAGNDWDSSLLDLLAVEICEWTGTGCAQPVLRRITAADRLPAQLRLTEGGIYRSVWNTRGEVLDPARIYRIRVLASGGELGHVDVEIVDPGNAANTGQTDHVRLVPGSSLPISFMIAQGAGERTGTEGGTVELADGAITLDLPAGAVSEDVFLTAVPAVNLPPDGPTIVPGTAWDIGPDGLVFDEPIVMTIPYDPASLPPGTDEGELRIHKLVNGTYEQQDAGLVDLVNKTVSAEVSGFSVFVIFERDPDNVQDIDGPVVRGLEVLDPATGTFGNATTLDVTTGDATLTTRIAIVDDGSGVSLIDIRWLSPSGGQMRFPCLTGNPPNSGSDTNGEWECQTTFPRYAESGAWRPAFVVLRDKTNNSRVYFPQAAGLCDPGAVNCIADVPQITVSSSPEDVDPPLLLSLAVSPDAQPRVFGPSVSVDASTGPRLVYFGFHATDALSGVGDFLPFDGFRLSLTGPSNQFQTSGGCTLTQGTNLDGFWECRVFVPGQAETGTWQLSRLRVPDRAGNGGFSSASDFLPGGAGQLCNPRGNCVSSPTIEVTSSGDGEPATLQSVSIVATGADVTTSLGITDNLAGVSSARVRYTSAVAPSQFQDCFAGLSAGTITDGTFTCTINFPQTAATGQWFLQVDIFDRAGNRRFYTRRASDGFLCYFDPATSTQVCQDFGDTDLHLLAEGGPD